ncbi:MAG TPA: hypothetical protein VGK40_10900 [Verrucomicrobiae bacterium]
MSAGAPPEPAIAFGLPNLPLGQAVIAYNEVSNLSSNGTDGVSIFLGEADNGVFFYPNTADQPEGGDYMLGKAYGRVDGVNGYPISILRGRKVVVESGFGVYPLAVDFTPIGVTNLTIQVFSGRHLVAESSVAGGETVVRTDFNGGSIIRANPWWQMPDGSLGAYFEFSSYTGFDFPSRDTNDLTPFGNILFVRADNPLKMVAFVSQLDVTSGGGLPAGEVDSAGDGLSSFRFEDLRLGKFGHAHKALESTILQATNGLLTVSPIDPGGDPGVSVEVNEASRFDVNLRPVALVTNGASLSVSAIGSVVRGFFYASPGYYLGSVGIANQLGTLHVSGSFSPIGTNLPRARVEVLRHGVSAGLSSELELIPDITLAGHPRVLRLGGLANRLDSRPGFSILLEQTDVFTIPNGAAPLTLIGDEIRIMSVDLARFAGGQTGYFESLTELSLAAAGLPSFTISSEPEERPLPPDLSINRSGNSLILSWPDPNRVFTLEGSTDGFDSFDLVSEPETFSSDYAFVTVHPGAESKKFFRLRRTVLD